MMSFEHRAVETAILRVAGGDEYWLKVYPRLLIAELTALADNGKIVEHEEHFAPVSLRLLGVDDAPAPSLIARPRELVAEKGIPEPKVRNPRRSRSATSS
jgi:hypothetical protein